jgi:hypothetical protein
MEPHGEERVFARLTMRGKAVRGSSFEKHHVAMLLRMRGSPPSHA